MIRGITCSPRIEVDTIRAPDCAQCPPKWALFSQVLNAWPNVQQEGNVRLEVEVASWVREQRHVRVHKQQQPLLSLVSLDVQMNADRLSVHHVSVGGRSPRLSLVFDERVRTESSGRVDSQKRAKAAASSISHIKSRQAPAVRSGSAGIIGRAHQQRCVPQLELLEVDVQVGEPVQVI